MSDSGVAAVPDEIDCIDCGGRCFRLTFPPAEGDWEPGEVVAYRCQDCMDRWDLVVPDDDDTAV